MKNFLRYLLISLGILSLAGVGLASAHGGFGGFGNWSSEDIVERFQTMFQKKAEILGIGVDEYKTAWAEGKNLMEIAEEQGITQEQLHERMQAERQEELREQLNLLVENGVITQEQADQRFNMMQERFENRELGEGFGGCRGRGGFGFVF